MTQEEQLLLKAVPDYVSIKRYGNSILALEKRYPNGCPTHIIAKALDTTEEDVEKRYQEIISLLRTSFGV